jgi:DNA-binding CsgD family transcriptional regulator
MDAPLAHILTQLSARQHECLSGVAAGLTSKEIARRLGISPSTVDNHIAVAIRLLECSSRQEAVRKLASVSDIDSHPRKPSQWIPVVGGKKNTDPPSHRIRQIIVIAFLGVAASAACIATILGLVQLLKS